MLSEKDRLVSCGKPNYMRLHGVNRAQEKESVGCFRINPGSSRSLCRCLGTLHAHPPRAPRSWCSPLLAKTSRVMVLGHRDTCATLLRPLEGHEGGETTPSFFMTSRVALAQGGQLHRCLVPVPHPLEVHDRHSNPLPDTRRPARVPLWKWTVCAFCSSHDDHLHGPATITYSQPGQE